MGQGWPKEVDCVLGSVINDDEGAGHLPAGTGPQFLKGENEMGSEEQQKIHASVRNPARSLFKQFRNEKAESEVVYCSASERCGLYARGECCLLGSYLLSYNCPYGRISRQFGYTKRARRYGAWIKEQQDKHKDVLDKLRRHQNKMTTIGDYVFLPYAHLDMNESLPLLAHGGFMRSGQPFLLETNFTVDTILRIIDFRPQAMMGGEITKYQKDIVPTFLIHLSEEFPKLYGEVIQKRPDLDSKRSNVGRKAFANTIKVGAVIKHKYGTYTWDGTFFLSSDIYVSFPFVEYAEIEAKLKPKDTACVTITSDDQVCETTKFKD